MTRCRAIENFRGSVDSILGTLDTNTARMQENRDLADVVLPNRPVAKPIPATNASRDTSLNVPGVRLRHRTDDGVKSMKSPTSQRREQYRGEKHRK